MNSARSAFLSVLVGAGAVLGAAPVLAQSWSGGGSPAFQSDIERQQRETEARREQLRAAHPVKYPKFMDGGAKPDIKPEAPPIAYLSQNETAGTVIVDTGGRKLYYVLPGNKAYEYPISVGRDGFTWTGTEKISRVADWPSWTPPPEMHKRQPGLPITVSGGVINPLGAKALYLGNTIYRIHGTNNERTIGRASSSGCFRMMNHHVVHLATLAKIGTTVRVVSNYSGASTNAPMTSLFSGFSFGGDDAPAKGAKNAKGQKKAKSAKLVKSAAKKE
jgi:lipoprotein-anchoring transpeptidase ErfK/SrfK